jgi:hypothetical protein
MKVDVIQGFCMLREGGTESGDGESGGTRSWEEAEQDRQFSGDEEETMGSKIGD